MKKNKNQIESIGNSTEDVTGSCFCVTFNEKRILLDCGFVQSNNDLEDYKRNYKTVKKCKAKTINAVILSHLHADHSALIPALFANGFIGIIYTPINSKQILDLMWKDSLKIMNQNVELFFKKYGVKTKPLYTEDDINKALSNIYEIDYNFKMNITDKISFEYVPSNHIVNSAQVVLYLDDGINTKKILYACDLGSIKYENNYIQNFQKVEQCDIAIVESTYATDIKSNNKKNRKKDIEKIESVVQYISENNGRIIIPTFSLQRSADLLTLFYEIFNENKNFNIPIIFDAVLGNKINNIWDTVIPDNKELWDNVWNWNKLIKVSDWNDSIYYQNNKQPMIILASGGFLVGRSTAYIKKFLSDLNTFILFCGFCGDVGSIGYKIKHSNEFPYVVLDGKSVKNNAKIISLNSFSSHISHNEMLDYYSNINCQRIYLVHGQLERRIIFKPMLEEEISKKNKSTKVIVMQSDTKIFI